MIKTVLVMLMLLFNLTFAQNKAEKLDKIITKDYSVIECLVSKISDKNIEYSYKGEKLINSIEFSKVARIEFATGRVQDFNTLVKSSDVSLDDANAKVEKIKDVIPVKKNTIAILPIPFVNTETLATSAEMAKFAQNDVYNTLLKSSANILPLTIQDLRVTNSLLKKAGIDYTNIDEVLVEDLKAALGVDHIIAAKVSYIIKVNQTNSQYGKTTINKKNDSKVKVDDFNFSSTNENKSFDFTVYFDIYRNDDKIYTKNRKPVLWNKDAWMDSMRYLLKRSPIYTK